jgi:signal transduction histidine kinase
VEITARNHSGVVNLTIADNGTGMTQQNARTGLGLIGIQERVRELGGWFTARNRDGGGTILTAEIPCDVPVVGHA